MTAVSRLDGIHSGLGRKAPVRVATTANITLSGEQTIDGVAVVSGDRVLVKNQTTASQNGIYVASTGAWTRAKDFDGARDVVKGTTVVSSSGTANAQKEWMLSTSDPITVGTTDLTFGALSLGVISSEGAIVATRTAMKALTTSTTTTAFLTEGKRSGMFKWDATVAIATHTADTQEGVYVAPNAAAAGAWVRQYDTLTPFHFGCLGDGASDDAVGLQAFFTYLKNVEVNGADFTGAFRSSVGITFGESAVVPLTRSIRGKLRITGTAAMTYLLSFHNATGSYGHITLVGTGSTLHSGRTIETGLYLNACSRAIFEGINCSGFQFAGIYGGFGNNTYITYGEVKVTNCGSGARNGTTTIYGMTTRLTAASVNNGSAGSVGQSTTLTVSDTLPAYCKTGVYGAVGDTPFMIRMAGPSGQRLFNIKSDSGAGSITVSPWPSTSSINPTTASTTSQTIASSGSLTFTVDAGRYFGTAEAHNCWVHIFSAANPSNYMRGVVTAYSGTSMTVTIRESSGSGTFTDWTIQQHCDYVFGAGLFQRGADSNVVSVGGVDAIRCGIGYASASLYGPQLRRLVSQFCGIGLAIGRTPAGAILGGQYHGVYFENNQEDIIFVTRMTNNTNTGATIESNYALNLAKVYVLDPVTEADGSFSSTYNSLQQVNFLYNGERHFWEDTTRNYRNSSASATLVLHRGGMERVYYRDTLTFTLSTLNIEHYNRLFGYDTIQVKVIGTGANEAPTGNIVFNVPATGTLNGGAVALTYNGFNGPAEFVIQYRFSTAGVLTDTVVTLVKAGEELINTVSTDANFTLTPGTSAHVTRHTGVLTADRTVTLSTTGASTRTKFRIARTGGGAFNLILGSTGKNLTTGTWAEVMYDGSAYVVTAAGSL